MNTKLFKWVSILLISVSFLLTACGSKATATAPIFSPVPPTATQPPTSTPFIMSPTSTVQPIVVTATGVSDLGVLLGNQPMTPVVEGLIDWDHLALMDEWEEFPGVAEGVQVLYVQSGVPNKINLPTLPGVTDSQVPTGTTLVVGGYSVSFRVGEKSYSFTKGFYGSFLEGTKVANMVIEDGFAVLVRRDDARAEYCARVAQAINQKWAHSHLYRPATWSDPVCEGVVTTPLDNDRPPVVTVTPSQ